MYYVTAIAVSASAGLLTYLVVRFGRQVKTTETADPGQR